MAPGFNIGTSRDFVFGGRGTKVSSFTVDRGCSPIPDLAEDNNAVGSQPADGPVGQSDAGPLAVIGGCSAEPTCALMPDDLTPFGAYEDSTGLIPTLDELLGDMSVSKIVIFVLYI